MEYIKIRNGVEIPVIGYGVYQVPADITYRCVRDALDVGYRHLDSAAIYANEKETGKAIKDSGIKREDIFLTSKIWIDCYTEERANMSIERSLRDLQTDYLDLLLLHHPFNDYYSAYRVMEKWYEEGKIRAIGVSNFYPDRLSDIAQFSKIPPMINQIEINPFFQQQMAIDNMQRYGCMPEAWAPFGEGKNNMFSNEVLGKIAQKHNKTIAQVILKWQVERGVIVLSKTTHKERMVENFNCLDFSLDEEDKELIKSLDTGKSVFYDHHDPNMVDTFANRCKEKLKKEENN